MRKIKDVLKMNLEGYMKVSQAAKLWRLTDRAVRKMCNERRIEGVVRKGNLYMIPRGTAGQGREGAAGVRGIARIASNDAMRRMCRNR